MPINSQEHWVEEHQNINQKNIQKSDIFHTIEWVKYNLESVLSNISQAYDLLREIEQSTKWYLFRQDTLEAVFKKYPSMSIENFQKYFLDGIYNKNILRTNPEIIDLLDLDNIEPGSDLIEIVINKVSMSQDDFEKHTHGKIDKITIPNMSSTDVAQWYFKSKLEEFLPQSEVIFWDMEEIRENLGYNQISADSVGFIDILWNGHLNSCLFKLFKTQPDLKKVQEINDIFENNQKDIFLGWSTFVIPFNTPDELDVVKMPKMEINNNPLELSKSNILLNSMWYLNSAYYADKVKGSFVLWSHNIAEPMHAGKLTVINNDTENRYNHNWLTSYFWEKTGLLMYTGDKLQNQDELEKFLTISQEEIQARNKEFETIYNEKIIPLVYWIFYKNLSKTFPNKIKAV